MAVYGVTPRDLFPGVSRVFEEGAKVCKEFSWVDIEAASGLKDQSVLIVGAWHPGYAMLLRRHPGPKFCLWTSPPLQSELSGVEMEYLQLILGLKSKGVIKDILWNDRGFAEAMGGVHFPHPYVCGSVSSVPVEDREGACLYAPAHPRKNILTQCLAAKLVGLKVHLNGAEPYHGILKALGVDFLDHGWFPDRAGYLAALGSAKLAMGVFLSESHCYSIHDALSLGVPAVLSHGVAANMLQSSTGVPVDDPEAIAERMADILNDYDREARYARSCAEEVAKRNNEGFQSVIRSLEV